MIANIDSKTGIHYGVISINSLYNSGEEFFDNAEDLTYQEMIKSIKLQLKGCEDKESLINILNDILGKYQIERLGADDLWQEFKDNEFDVEKLWNDIEQDINDHYQCDTPSLRYEKGGYILQSCFDNTCLFVIQSPFYTYCRQCSPCAPNAGDLDNSDNGCLKTFCLGPNWFDEENPCPYPVGEVEKNNLLCGQLNS